MMFKLEAEVNPQTLYIPETVAYKSTIIGKASPKGQTYIKIEGLFFIPWLC